MKNFAQKVQRFLAAEDDGATAVEYAIMVSLISVVVIAAVTLLGGRANNKFQEAADAL